MFNVQFPSIEARPLIFEAWPLKQAGMIQNSIPFNWGQASHLWGLASGTARSLYLFFILLSEGSKFWDHPQANCLVLLRFFYAKASAERSKNSPRTRALRLLGSRACLKTYFPSALFLPEWQRKKNFVQLQN